MTPFSTAYVSTSIGLLVGVPIGLSFAMLLVPGRKGTMRGERQMSLPAVDLVAARSTIIELFQREGFAIDLASADVIRGTRHGAGAGKIHAHADKTMKAEAGLRTDVAGTLAMLSVWLDDFVFHDTGESRVVDQQLERFLHGPSAVPPTPVPNVSYMATSTLVSGGLAIALLCSLGVVAPTPARVGVLAGVTLGAAGNLFMAIWAKLMIRRRSAELTGGPRAIASIVLAILGLIGCALVASGHYGPLIRRMIAEDVG